MPEDSPFEHIETAKKLRLTKQYFIALVKHLSKPNGKNLMKAIKLADRKDFYRNNYWGWRWKQETERQSINDIKERIKKLENGDKMNWAKFIFVVGKESFLRESFRKLKKLSPFKDKLIFSIEIDGCNSIDVHSESEFPFSLKGRIFDLIIEIKDIKTPDINDEYTDSDEYLIVLPQTVDFNKLKELERLTKTEIDKLFRGIEVFWLLHGTLNE